MTPFFVVGASRSGTTMLRLMLNAHPRLAVPGEFGYFHRLLQAGLDPAAWRDEQAVDRARFEAFLDDFLRRKKPILGEVDLDRLRAAVVDGPRDLRSPLVTIMQAYLAGQGKARWGEKTPQNIFYADVAADMFPEAPFVQMIRDPRGAVYSMLRFPRLPDDAALNAFNWRRAVREGGAHLSRHVAEDRLLTVRFEHLVSDPERELTRICAHLGETFEPAMLEFHREARTHMHPNQPRLGGLVNQPVAAGAGSKWARGMSRRDVAIVEHVCGAEMEELGYERVGSRLPVATAAVVGAKLGYCAWQCRRNRALRLNQIKFVPLGRLRRGSARGETRESDPEAAGRFAAKDAR